MNAKTGYLSEIFCSIQGEGIYVGERQAFVRTAGCSAACCWCDTPASKNRSALCVVHGTERRSLPNPVTVDHGLAELRSLIRRTAPVRTVSITGGEPLEQPEYIGALAEALKLDGMRVYLDTNGLHPEAMTSLSRLVDVVAMDIKLPSATGEDNWEVHREFLRTLSDAEAFVKIVVDSGTPADELERAVRLIALVDPDIPLVLQPEGTVFFKPTVGTGSKQALIERLEHGQRFALGHLRDVRVIPQCHRLLGVK
ncbi:MAG: 7-carboxy-7-deazaguanine synthase QueE [bacterium]